MTKLHFDECTCCERVLVEGKIESHTAAVTAAAVVSVTPALMPALEILFAERDE